MGGEELDGVNHTVRALPAYLPTIVALWVRLAMSGYRRCLVQQMLGKMVRAMRPGLAAMPFLPGSYVWLIFGPEHTTYTPSCTAARRHARLVHCLPTLDCPPPPTRTLDRETLLFVDAAPYGRQFIIGTVSNQGRYHIQHAPSYVRNKQIAELYGVEQAVKHAAYRGQKFATVVGDNLPSLT